MLRNPTPDDKPTRVLLMRHAETAAPHLLHGAESDVGLSKWGRQQAEAIAPTLALRSPAAVISSPMRRAVETAAPIARACGLPLTIEPAFYERRIGSLCGQPYDSTKGPWAETIRRWRAGDLACSTPGAESFLALRDRVLPAWHCLAHSLAGQTYVIIAHGAVINVLLLSLDLLPATTWDNFSCPNLGLFELLSDRGRWHLGQIKILLPAFQSKASDACELHGGPGT